MTKLSNRPTFHSIHRQSNVDNFTLRMAKLVLTGVLDSDRYGMVHVRTIPNHDIPEPQRGEGEGGRREGEDSPRCANQSIVREVICPSEIGDAPAVPSHFYKKIGLGQGRDSETNPCRGRRRKGKKERNKR